MRVSSVALAAALALTSLSASLSGQRPDDVIEPRSMALVSQARAARTAGDLERATDLLETAVTVDPRNRAGFTLLAEVAEARDLPGKAIRFYREALLLEPNDTAALRGQGEALVRKGAVNRAQENLARIKSLCKGQCPDAGALAGVIAKGPPITTAAITPAQPKIAGTP